MYEINEVKRFLLVGLVPMGTKFEKCLLGLEEAKSLVETYGGEVVSATVQKSHDPDKSRFVGTGKVEEIADIIEKEKIDIVVINDIATPVQIFSLQQRFARANEKIEVWDRMDLILHIFALHARTTEAKLQIELASLRHMGPKAYNMGHILSKQSGGIGGKGAGETNTELMKRHWQREMNNISKELSKLLATRGRQIERRKNLGYLTISLIGYTNAGKTQLFNRLTKKENYVSEHLFATLESTIGKIRLKKYEKEITVSDTIDFIQNLPTGLIEAFKSTLLESVGADLLLIVGDASDQMLKDKLHIVEEILRDLKIGQKKRLYIFNKVDQIGETEIALLKEQFAHRSPIFISAKTGQGLDTLFTKIREIFLYTPGVS